MQKFNFLGESISEPFKECFRNSYIDCVNLSFGENLKKTENRDVWIAFQRMLLEETREKLIHLENNQSELISIVKEIKGSLSSAPVSAGLSQEDIKSIEELKGILQNKELIKVSVNKGTNKKINLLLQNSKDSLAKLANIESDVKDIRVFLQSQWQQRIDNEILTTRISLGVAGVVISIASVLVYIALTQPFTLSIQTYGWKGENHQPLKGEGVLEIVLGDNTEQAEINKKGEAIFRKIDHKFNQESVSIRLRETRGEPYYLSDSVVLIKKDRKNMVQIQVKGIDRLKGLIIDKESGDELEGAYVEVGDITTQTDNKGRFVLSIPIDKRELEQKISVYKDGYTTYRATIPMVNEEECRIILSRK